MKRYIWIAVVILSSCSTARPPYYKQLEDMKKVKKMPYIPDLSGDERFWNAVKYKIDIVPSLIEMIPNKKMTKAHVPYFGGDFTVGDVAYHVITEIIRDVPTLDLIRDWPKFEGSLDFGNYWRYMRESEKNREQFRSKVKSWYEKNKSNLVWVVDDKLYLKEDREGAKRYPHPAGGYYIIGDRRVH